MGVVVFALNSLFTLLLLCYFLFHHASASCVPFIASSLTLPADSLHSLTLLLPVCWDGSRTAGSVLQSSVSSFNIPIQSPLAVFSHPAHAGTLSLTLLLLLSFFTTFHFISNLVLSHVCLCVPLSLCFFVQSSLHQDDSQFHFCHSSELADVQESGKNIYISSYSRCVIISYFWCYFNGISRSCFFHSTADWASCLNAIFFLEKCWGFCEGCGIWEWDLGTTKQKTWWGGSWEFFTWSNPKRES